MSKRILLFAVVLFLALVIIIGFIVLQKKNSSTSNPIKAIPVDAALILQINDFHNFETEVFRKNKVFGSLQTIQPFNTLFGNIKTIDSLAQSKVDFGELLYNSKIYMSAHFIGGRKSDFLFLIQAPNGDNFKKSIEIFSDISNQDIKNTERKYEGKPIFILNINIENEKQPFYISEIEGNILISKSVILIENAIRQYSQSKSLLSDEGFLDIISTAGRSKVSNLFIDLRKFTGILSTIGNPEYSSKIKDYQSFAGWTELDLNASENLLMLNGFISSEPSENNLETIFRDNNPVNLTADKILPSSIATFISFGSEDINLLNQNFLAYMASIGKKESRSKNLQAFENNYGYRLDELFLSFVDDEITIARDGSKGSSNAPSTFFLLKCKSGEQADETLRKLIKKVSKKKGTAFTRLISHYTVDSDTKIPIIELPLKDVTGLVFGNLFSIESKSYYTRLGNYLIFSNSRNALGEFIYSNILSKTLSTDEAFKVFNNNIAQKSYLLFYSNLGRSSAIFKEYLNSQLLSAWENNFESFQKIQPFGFQITEVSSMNYVNFLIQYLDDIKGKPQTVWESLLDTTFSFKPQLVENHYSKQNEIFIQDDGNSIYLINKAGRILWKQKIAETINSKVFQIDFYKNGKLQYLFSSDNYLHLIDRNGNYVERYPVRLREKSTTGMALFDYEQNRNYRIFIPCIDKKIHAYTKDGSLISGWQFQGSDNPVKKPLKHFRIGEKDFIVFADKFRLYILDRRGNTRIPVSELITKAQHSEIYLKQHASLDKSRLITSDTTGSVISVDFSGKVSKTSVGKFSSRHFFDFKDIDADGNKDYVFMDENQLVVYGQNKSEIYNFNLPNVIREPSIYFNFSYNDRKIGIVDSEDKKIYLLNPDGNLYKGFPLEGSTLFSIGYLQSSSEEFNLIVGGRNNFLYNYSVQ